MLTSDPKNPVLAQLLALLLDIEKEPALVDNMTASLRAWMITPLFNAGVKPPAITIAPGAKVLDVLNQVSARASLEDKFEALEVVTKWLIGPPPVPTVEVEQDTYNDTALELFNEIKKTEDVEKKRVLCDRLLALLKTAKGVVISESSEVWSLDSLVSQIMAVRPAEAKEEKEEKEEKETVVKKKSFRPEESTGGSSLTTR